MKNIKNTSIAILLITIICSQNKLMGQATSASPILAPGPNRPNTAGVDYLGWDNTVGVPLNIKHENSQPINFYTNNLPRMTLDATGRFGLGTSTPLGLFHMDDNASSNTDFRITNASTGNTASGTLLTRCLCAETSFIN